MFDEESNPFSKLNLSDFPEHTTPDPEDLAKKNRKTRFQESLELHEGLADRISAAMQNLIDSDRAVPLFHFTSSAIRFPDGLQQSTGYLENIKSNGFRAKDTNVAVLTTRDGKSQIANPEYFKEHPADLLEDFVVILKRYRHHSTRTNKQSLGEHRETGVGVPALIVIDGKIPMKRGTDYEDHYIFDQAVPADKILGTLDIDDVNPNDLNSVCGLVDAYVSMIQQG